MQKTTNYCDHCGKLLDKEDYLEKDIEAGPVFFKVDSCTTCFGKFISICEKFWIGEEFKRVDKC